MLLLLWLLINIVRIFRRRIFASFFEVARLLAFLALHHLPARFKERCIGGYTVKPRSTFTYCVLSVIVGIGAA
jgi:hypothetical protein